MATTVSDDYTIGAHQLEDLTGVISHTLFGGNVSSAATDAIRVEGTLSVGMRVNGTGVGGLAIDPAGGTFDVTDKHTIVWMFTMHDTQTYASDGIQIGYSSAAAANSNVGMITAGGRDTNIGPYNNFHCWCVDAHAPFNANVNGTPPALSAVTSYAVLWDFTTSNGRISAFVDEIKTGTQLRLSGGTSGVPGNSDDVTTNDRTNATGIFKNVGGIIYVLGGVRIGDVATGTSHFTDTGKVWNFEDGTISATFHKVEIVGNGTGTNECTFGTLVGSGITANGSGGNTFQAGGAVPFRVEAIDSNTGANFYGCNMINSPALKEDPWRRVITEDGAVFVDDTRDANDAGTNDVNPFPAAPATNDRFNMGSHERFSHASITVGTAGAGTYTVAWQYSTGGTSFSALTDVTDGTNGFKTAGANTVTFAIPDDWAKGTVNGVSMYWIRAVITMGTQTTRAAVSVMTAGIGGGARLEQANAEAISGTWTNMDTIRIRNGALFRKVTVVNSVASTKSGAIDLGSADPTADSFRDITIIGANKGILLKGTSTGTTTYNFRNIKFSGNTNDVRVDFPTAATVVINILQGGDSPSIDNVNTSTVTINNAVNVSLASVTEGTSVKFIANETVGTVTKGDVIAEGFADSTGTFTTSLNYQGAFDPSGLDIIVKARNQGIAVKVWQEDNSGASFVDETIDASSNATGDVAMYPATPAINDAFYLSHTEQFDSVRIDILTAAAGTHTLLWEYWNGSAWASLTVTRDDTTNMTAVGTDSIVQWTIPGNWAATTVNGSSSLFYVRLRISAFTSMTTVPLASKLALNVTRFLPYTANRVITGTGLADNASWTEDSISSFFLD